MALYRIEVGSEDGLEVRNIVGAIANEAGIRSRYIGQIRIHPKYSTVEMPDDLPDGIVAQLRSVYVVGKAMKMSRIRQHGEGPADRGRKPAQHKAGGISRSGKPRKPGKRKAARPAKNNAKNKKK